MMWYSLVNSLVYYSSVLKNSSKYSNTNRWTTHANKLYAEPDSLMNLLVHPHPAIGPYRKMFIVLGSYAEFADI